MLLLDVAILRNVQENHAILSLMNLFADLMPTPVGNLFLVWEGDILRRLHFSDHAPNLPQTRAPQAIRGALEAYFEGDITAIDRVQVQADGTPFQMKVWKALREIPAGETISYGELAARIGQPTASRAVGLANGSNPISIVVPCHRVIGANGKLTGYGGGLERKRWLLDHERGGLFVAQRPDRVHVKSAAGG
jgi:methylated-DNA-[protein]-cysteine S-methyltransferase